MDNEEDIEFTRVPGLYRIFDLQSVISPGADYEVRYAEMTGDGVPLYAIYRGEGRQSLSNPSQSPSARICQAGQINRCRGIGTEARERKAVTNDLGGDA